MPRLQWNLLLPSRTAWPDRCELPVFYNLDQVFPHFDMNLRGWLNLHAHLQTGMVLTDLCGILKHRTVDSVFQWHPDVRPVHEAPASLLQQWPTDALTINSTDATNCFRISTVDPRHSALAVLTTAPGLVILRLLALLLLSPPASTPVVALDGIEMPVPLAIARTALQMQGMDYAAAIILDQFLESAP